PQRPLTHLRRVLPVHRVPSLLEERNESQADSTIGRAKLGYINDRAEFDGRLVNTISLDQERAPLIRFAFEQYATDRYSVWQLAGLLSDMGLTSRGPRDRPTRPVSTSAVAKILRDPYYTGMLPYKGELYAGRHPALVTQETFEVCQAILDRRNRRGDRDFIHFHYLKGLLYCGLCRTEGRTRRLVYSQSQGNGGVYEYWVCSGKTRDGCRLPSLRMEEIEMAVAAEVVREGLTPGDIAVMRVQLQETADEMQAQDQRVKEALRSELRKLEGQEERLIELAADGAVSTPKLREKLNDITLKKRVIAEKLTHTIERLTAGAERAAAQLDLLERPGPLYRNAEGNVRRDLISGLFERFVVTVDEDGSPALSSQRTVVNGAVHELNRRNHARNTPAKTKKASRDSAEGSLTSSLQANSLSEGWNIHDMVGVTGFEPAASSSRTTRATKLRHTPWPTL
ncbi:Recombinase zinc beta ribbon domain-containing protein, partial [Microbacterium sp. RURRCA19A]